MGKVRVERSCRDCKKCTNSGVANMGRNSGRTSAALMTVGLSEVGFRAFAKKCRLCDHQLSLHQGAEAATPQPAVSFAAPAPAASSGPSTIEQLKDLGALRDAGVLTEEEFATQKARLLG